MYELSILKSLLNKETYTRYRGYIKDDLFDRELRYILKGIDRWYTTNELAPTIEDVANLTFANGVPEKEIEFVKGVIGTIRGIDGQESVTQLLEKFRTSKLMEDISVAAYDASQGRKSVTDVLKLASCLGTTEKIEPDYVTDDLESILNDTVKEPGLRWRLASLNRSLGSLRKGDFGFIFARPETGKTTFLASEVTFMAEQLKEEDGPILWFNNEEQGKKVKLRCYQAVLGKTLSNLMEQATESRTAYQKRIKDKIRIIDSASISRWEVEALCESVQPSLIIFDQIDKIKGFKADREDLAMGAIYQWARETAKKFAPVIGICQADGTAEGEKWLFMDHVANAKTAKQGEADFILGIGKVKASGLEDIRYFNISKNKLAGDPDTVPSYRHARWEVLIEPDIARYRDLSGQ